MHSVAAGIFQSKDQIHFFRDIGYQHDSFAHCPDGADWSIGKCSCNPKDNFGKWCPHFTLYPAHLKLSRIPVWMRFVRLHQVLVSGQVADRKQLRLTYRCDGEREGHPHHDFQTRMIKPGAT